jgi:hypothetical protein
MIILIFTTLFPIFLALIFTFLGYNFEAPPIRSAQQSAGDTYNGPIYIDAYFSVNPTAESFTFLNVSIYTYWIHRESAPSEFVDVNITINSNLTVLYKGEHVKDLNLKLFWKRETRGYCIYEHLIFLVNSALPVGDYPLSITIKHGIWEYTASDVLRIRKPLKIIFYVTDENGHPLKVNEFRITSKIRGVFKPEKVDQGVFQVVLPEGDYDIVLNYTDYLFGIPNVYTSPISVHDEKTVTLTLKSCIDCFDLGALVTIIFVLCFLFVLYLSAESNKLILGGFLFCLSLLLLMHSFLKEGIWIFPPDWGPLSLFLTLLIPFCSALNLRGNYLLPL